MGNLYGEQVGLSFVDRIRSERRFRNADELTSQIRDDVVRGRQLLRDGR